ncbi:MAG: preprotein translocase subunit SecG [Flavobacteriia bacterium]|nr:preprotein translocase subunit SecG [Flavobacteriia bacterium]
MTVLLSLIIIIASILLTLVVFVQNPKGGGLSSDFGAAHQLGGVKKTNDFIEKATWTLAGVIAVVSIVLTVMKTPEKPKVIEQPQAEQGQSPQGGNQNSK